MNKFYKKLLPVALLFCSFNFLHAQVGVYDPSFGNGGKIFQLFNNVDVSPSAVIAQPDGKIIVGGSGGDFFEGVFKIVRYNVNGTIDASFGNNGIVTFDVPNDNDVLESLALQPDGKILAGGIIQTTDPVTQDIDRDFHIFRLKADGTYDSTFGINGRVVTDISVHSDDFLHKIILKPDGKVLAGGYFMDMNNGDNFYGLVQYKENGNRDSTFGTNGITVLPLPQQENGKGSLALLADGKILAATTVVNETTFFYEFGLVRFTATGAVDATFGNAGVLHLELNYFHSILHDMAIQSDGKIVLTGETPADNSTAVAVVRLDSEGAYDPGFGTNGVVRTHLSAAPFTPDAGMSLTIQPDNKIIVGATLYNSINSYDANFAVVRYLPDGRIDRNYGRQGIIITDFDENGDYARACLQQPDGKFVLVGPAKTINSEVGFGIVRYLSDARFYYNTLKGSVYYDSNSNGVLDPGEDFLGNATVLAEKAGIDTTFITAATGRFSVEIDTGNYIIRPVQPYYTGAPIFKNINHATYFNTDSVSFAMQPIEGIRDLFVYIIPLHPARPGFESDYMIMYGNNGTDTVPLGSVQFVPSSFINVTSTEPVPASTSGDTLRWNYVNLYPHDTAYIFVQGTVLPPPTVNIGDTLRSFASILPAGFDEDPKDNIFVLREEVIGSFDPNDKGESHAGRISTEEVNSGEYLQYMIRFQNTGTDTAFNIYVRDTLQNMLDWNTFEMVYASHPYRLEKENGICVWSFNNIALVDVTHNEPKSHGFIVYRIKPKTNLIPGDIITNDASIYFDFNLPVETNVERTLVVSTTIPVKLLSFYAKKSGSKNLLQWSTTYEVNADRFEAERSKDGTYFEKIGSVSSRPAGTGINNYDYTDAFPIVGRNYYRLKMVDKDGRFEYSPVRMLSNTASDYFTLYPNPVKDNIYIKIEQQEKSSMQVQVLSLEGKGLLTAIWEVDEGTSVKKMNTSGLTAGTYFVKIISDKLANKKAAEIVLKFQKF